MTKYYLMQGTTVLDETYVNEIYSFKHAESYFLWAGWFVKATIIKVDSYDDDQPGKRPQMEYDYQPKKVKEE